MGSGADKLTYEDRIDKVEKPPHYTYGKIEPINVIEDWDLPYHLACVIKYIARYRHKGTPQEDIEKAKQYIELWLKKENNEM